MDNSSPIVSGADYLKLPRSPETWLVEGLLPVEGAMLLYGDAKVGKSYAALQLACNLTSGVEWLGFSIPQPVQTVYVQLDTPRSLWADRVEQLRDAGHPVETIHFADRETLQAHPFDILDPDHFSLLNRSIMEIKPGVVIVDTLRESHSGDENDSTEMQDVIAHLTAAVKPAALILISHSRKANPEQGYSLMNDNRGSNYIVGRMDAIVRFTQKGIRCSSRTMEEHSIDLERRDDGTWELLRDTFKEGAKELMASAGQSTSVREMARILHERFPRHSEASCRAVLRRLLSKSGSGPC